MTSDKQVLFTALPVGIRFRIPTLAHFKNLHMRNIKKWRMSYFIIVFRANSVYWMSGKQNIYHMRYNRKCWLRNDVIPFKWFFVQMKVLQVFLMHEECKHYR